MITINQPSELKQLNLNLSAESGELVIKMEERHASVNISLNAAELEIVKDYINLVAVTKGPWIPSAKDFIANGFKHTPSFSEEDVKLFSEIFEEIIAPALVSHGSRVFLRFGKKEANSLHPYGIVDPNSRILLRLCAYLVAKGFNVHSKYCEYSNYNTVIRVGF